MFVLTLLILNSTRRGKLKIWAGGIYMAEEEDVKNERCIFLGEVEK